MGKSAHAVYTKFASGHLRSGDGIVHVNTGQWKLMLAQKLLYGPPWQVMLMCLFAYVGTTVFFAAIYLAFGPGCYKFDNADDWGFALCLWISVHVFSTIGFGNIAPTPRCVGPQLALLVEFFFSLLIVSAIGGYVVKQFLKPISAVRFSKNVLINHGRRRLASIEEARSGIFYKFLTFRVVRQGSVRLRDVHIHIQGQWVERGDAYADRDHHKGRVGTLKLEQDKFTTLEQLQVWHRLDEHSPLWPIRDSLGTNLDGIEVSVSAFDTASLQVVKLFHRYTKAQLVRGRAFVNTFSPHPKNEDQLLADHSLLDVTEPEDGDVVVRPLLPEDSKKASRNRRCHRANSDERLASDRSLEEHSKPSRWPRVRTTSSERIHSEEIMSDFMSGVKGLGSAFFGGRSRNISTDTSPTVGGDGRRISSDSVVSAASAATDCGRSESIGRIRRLSAGALGRSVSSNSSLKRV